MGQLSNTFNKVLFSSALVLLLSACGDNSNANATATASVDKEVQLKRVSGHTTLANALVCLDANENGKCDGDEAQSQTSEDGSYSLEIDASTPDGVPLLAQDGYNLILEQSNLKRFRFKAPYIATLDENNINTITSLLDTDLDMNEAVTSLASLLNLDSETLLQDPIALAQSDDLLFLSIRGIEDGYTKEKTVQAVKKVSFNRASAKDEYLTPSTKESLVYLEDKSYLDFDTNLYLTRLRLKIENFFAGVRNFFASTLGFNKLSTNVEREELTGVWLNSKVDSDAKKCVVFTNQDEMITYSDGDLNETVSFYFSEESSLLSVIEGWSVVSKSRLEDNNSDYNSFKLYNEDTNKDNAQYLFTRSESLSNCLEQMAVVEDGDAENIAVPSLATLNGKVTINTPEGTRYEALKVTYVAVDNEYRTVTLDENGSFSFISESASENMLIAKATNSVTLYIEAKMSNDTITGFRQSNAEYVVSVDDAQNPQDIRIDFVQVDVCVNEYDTFKLITVDSTLNVGKNDGNDISFFITKDTSEHTLILQGYDTNSTANRIFRFSGDNRSLDLRDSCINLAKHEEPEITVELSQASDNNQSEIILEGYYTDGASLVAVNEEDNKITKNYAITQDGYYLLKIVNHSDVKYHLLDREVTFKVFGKTYTSRVESLEDDTAIFGVIVVLGNNYIYLTKQNSTNFVALQR